VTALYTWPLVVRYSITVTFILCALVQTLATIMSFYRYPRSRRWAFETLLELFVLFQVFACSLIHGEAMQGFLFGMIPQTGHGASRTALFAALVLLSAAVLILNRKQRGIEPRAPLAGYIPWPLLVVAASSLTLPVVGRLSGDSFAYLFLAAIVFWLARGIHIVLSRHSEIRSGISALSVKNAVDSLHTGVAFSEQGGHILLSNAQMQRLMAVVTGKVRRNSREFYGLLDSGEVDPRCEVKQFEGERIIILPDGSAWKFSMTDIRINRKNHIQLTATDVSERWQLTSELQSQNEDLTRRQEELYNTIANLYIISHEKQTQNVKMRTHDILSERLTLMQRAMRYDQAVDYALLHSLSAGMIDELKAAGSALPPQDELEIVRQTFARLGVDILLGGKLPDDNERSRLAVDIAREAITNAVRHGFATQVRIQSDDAGGSYRLQITDNGRPAPGEIKEGGGIAGMRRRLARFGGELAVIGAPQFTLAVTIPKSAGDEV